MSSKNVSIASWIMSVVVAVIYLQTLFFKLTGAEETIYIFETLGVESWGRYGTAVAELAAAVLLLVPRTRIWGVMLSLGVITGALVSHLTKLGIEVQGDGGLLFSMAVTVLIASLGLLMLHRDEIPSLGGS